MDCVECGIAKDNDDFLCTKCKEKYHGKEKAYSGILDDIVGAIEKGETSDFKGAVSAFIKTKYGRKIQTT